MAEVVTSNNEQKDEPKLHVANNEQETKIFSCGNLLHAVFCRQYFINKNL